MCFYSQPLHTISTVSITSAWCVSWFSSEGALRWTEGSVSCRDFNGCSSIRENRVLGTGDSHRTNKNTVFMTLPGGIVELLQQSYIKEMNEVLLQIL